MTKVLEAADPPPPPELEKADPVEELRQSTFITSKDERLLRCFVCVGKALRLFSTDPILPSFCRQFNSPGEVTKHFKRLHLANLPDHEQLQCPVCNPIVMLQDKQHFRNHAHVVHGLWSLYITGQ